MDSPQFPQGERKAYEQEHRGEEKLVDTPCSDAYTIGIWAG